MNNRTIPNSLSGFKRYLIEQDRSERTVEAYLSDLSKFVVWFERVNGQPFEPPALTAIDAREYRAHLIDMKAAPATINRVLATLRSFGESTVQAGCWAANPINAIKGVDEQPHAPKWLDKREQAALLREIDREVNVARTPAARRQAIRDRAFIMLLLNTGLRVGEACALELGDMTLSERKGSVVVRRGKGTKQRNVPLNADVRGKLHEWLGIRPVAPHEAVFVGQRGEALRPRAAQRMLADFGQRAGVEVTPHTLRHTFAKNLINAGVTMEKVAALLGHSNLNTTRIYVTPSVEDLQAAVAMVG